MAVGNHTTYEEDGITYDDIRMNYDGLHAGDVVNVYEVANLVGRGPVLSPAFARNSSRRSSNPNNHRP